MAKELENLTNVVSNLYEEFETSNDIIPENVGYFSIDKRELRIGDGLTRWKDIVPFIYNEVTLDIINDWVKKELDNVPNSVIVHDRFVPLEESNVTNTEHINDLLTRMTYVEGNKAPNSHASTANTYGLASGTKYGHTKLSDKTDDTSDISKGIAATPNAVNKTYTLATTANNTANAAMPKAGGTFTGPVYNNSTYSSSGTAPYYRTVTTSITKGTAPGESTGTYGFRITDSTGAIMSAIKNSYMTTKENRTDVIVRKGTDTSTTEGRISVGYNKDGNVFTYAPTPATGDNSTQIATTAFVNTTIKKNSVPVGTIIMYWGTTAPTGYLVCNGQSITESKYPKLYALCGANVPNLQDYFVRGATSSKPVGTEETDAGRNITGNIYYAFTEARKACDGCFEQTVASEEAPQGDDYNCFNINFDASRSWGSAHTASEFRPKNKRVLFCIKCDE